MVELRGKSREKGMTLTQFLTKTLLNCLSFVITRCLSDVSSVSLLAYERSIISFGRYMTVGTFLVKSGKYKRVSVWNSGEYPHTKLYLVPLPPPWDTLECA